MPQSSWPFPPGTPPEISPPVPVGFDAPAPPDDLADRLLERRIVMVNGPLDFTRQRGGGPIDAARRLRRRPHPTRAVVSGR